MSPFLQDLSYSEHQFDDLNLYPYFEVALRWIFFDKGFLQKLSKLSNDETIVIKPADKGGAAVILSTKHDHVTSMG